MDVGSNVRNSALIGKVNLWNEYCVEGGGQSHGGDPRHRWPAKLIRVLDGRGALEVIVEVIGGREVGRARVVDAYVGLCIFAEGCEEIGGIGRESHAIGRLQAPGLSTQELPLVALQVQPVEADAVSVRIGSYKHVGGIVAVEVELKITGDVVLAVFGVGPQVEPGVLSSNAVICTWAGCPLVAVGNSPEVGRGHVTGVGSAEDVFKVDEAAGRELCRAVAERKRRLLGLRFLPVAGYGVGLGRRVGRDS